ncbi:hypothetical protein [Marinobacter goseongensis]|jgi:hypothetical protein|uniref:hypothetical protein n=1 Tax=Marinobacter goseongensis TaxID=453838 RepID=UPI0020032D65|nr:hypothetical protein [Marinobacter goseongensis]MCK7551860.1 hypothetical protein [Marinobacter goseongensis]
MNRFRQITLRLSFLFVVSALNGCASYYSHYGAFPAENSAGEARQVVLSWQTAEYPGWWVKDSQSTPIRVATQCSERAWRLTDDSHRDPASCGDGIRACGRPGQDLVAASGQPAGEDDVCLSIDPGESLSKVTDIGQSMTLLVSCEPVSTSRQAEDEEENTDYLRASVVPYRVYIRKAPRGALNGRPPAVDDSVCDAD